MLLYSSLDSSLSELESTIESCVDTMYITFVYVPLIMLAIFGIIWLVVWIAQSISESNADYAYEKMLEERENWIKNLTPEEIEEKKVSIVNSLILEGDREEWFREDCKEKNIVFASPEDYEAAWKKVWEKEQEELREMYMSWSLERLFERVDFRNSLSMWS